MKTTTFSLDTVRKSVFLLLILGVVGLVSLQAQDTDLKMTRDDLAEFVGEEGWDIQPNEIERSVAPVGTQASPQNGLKTNACSSAFIMNTPYNSNNGQRGCMFDVTATNGVVIRCFEANLYAGTTANYEIYFKLGTHVGFENNAAAWTLLGGATGITSAGNNVPTALPITVNVTIPAGQTAAFYITNDFGAGTSYTDGTAVGNFLASDVNITVFEGVGKSYPFGLTFPVRNFNGTIFYDLESLLDADTPQLRGLATASGNELSWSLSDEQSYSEIELERSEDGLDYRSLQDLPLVGEGTWVDTELSAASTVFYRLSLRDNNGEQSFSNVVEVTPGSGQEFSLLGAYPNPFTDLIQVRMDVPEAGPLVLSLQDQMGKVLLREQHALEVGSQALPLELEGLPAGVYYLQCIYGGKSYTQVLLGK